MWSFFLNLFFVASLVSRLNPTIDSNPAVLGERSANFHALPATSAYVQISKVITYPSPIRPPKQSITPAPKAIKIAPHTYRAIVKKDLVTGGEEEIFSALNSYRSKNGRSQLTLDNKLCEIASKRAKQQSVQDKLDSHAGFKEIFNNPSIWKELSLKGVGENVSYNYQVSGKKLIDEVFASDDEHQKIQLDPKWNRVCVSVAGKVTEILFGEKRD